MRRHEVQFTKAERDKAEAVRQEIIRGGRVRFTDHCRQAAKADRATDSQIADGIKFGRIIEMSRRGGELRIVTRHEVAGVAHCTVITQSGWAVTYWQNRAADRHETLDLSNYAAQPMVA